MPSGEASSGGSLAKKRARDRRAQQSLRDRQQAHKRVLEERITALEADLKIARQTCHNLRQENEELRGRQEGLRQLVSSWEPRPTDVQEVDPTETRVWTPATGSTPSQRTEFGRTPSALEVGNSQEPNKAISDECVPSGRVEPRRKESYSWDAIPANSDSKLVNSGRWPRWFARLDLIAAAPDIPPPVDLLFGSRTNFLANIVHEGMRRWPCREPERLANGWLSYNLIKWITEPSETRFARLADFQKPVLEQLRHPHPYFIDFMLWPALRENLVKNRHLYDADEVMGLMACCLKVRWPWNKPVLEPDDTGQLQIRPEFFDTFTNIQGWGLTDDFASRYPGLFEGLDAASFRFDFSDAFPDGS